MIINYRLFKYGDSFNYFDEIKIFSTMEINLYIVCIIIKRLLNSGLDI